MSSPEREYPRGDPRLRWCANAEVSEDNAISCLECAAQADSEGRAAMAERFRRYAAAHRADRDRIQREHEMRTLNRRTHRRS